MVHETVFSGLSVPRTALIGRERDLTAINNMFQREETRLITLTGVGGSGKTHLALQIARDLASAYPRRTWFVELGPVADAELVPPIVATTVGLREVSSHKPLVGLKTFFASSPALLVLDNCEHLIDACAILVDTLLRSCPGLRIITTSREPLQVAGERQYRVPPLATPDDHTKAAPETIADSPAVRLFMRRSQDVLPSFQLTPDNAATVARIVVRLSGIPLALELAAAWVHLLGIEEIFARLDDSFRFLNNGNRVAPTRHQTLRAALDWSEALLTDDEQKVFRRLAVFSGEFQLATAESVCSSEDLPQSAVFDALTGLVNKSLVVAVSGHRTAWYYLLEPVRQYALTHLEQSGEAWETRSRHAHAYLVMAEQSAEEFRGPNQEIWSDNLVRQQNNLRSTLEWALKQDVSLGLRVATALVPFWETNGNLIEGQRRLGKALAVSADVADHAVRMRALRGAGRLTFTAANSRSQYVEAEEYHRQSLEIALAIGDRHGTASAMSELGMVYRLQREHERSVDMLSSALDVFRELDDPHGIALTLLNLGSTLGFLEESARATLAMTESLERFESLGDLRSVAIAKVLLGQLSRKHGNLDDATRLSIEAIEIHARIHDRWFVGFDLKALAETFVATRQFKRAVLLYSAAQNIAAKIESAVAEITFGDLIALIETLRHEDWFEGEWQKGQGLDLAQTVELAHSMLTLPVQAQAGRRSAGLDHASLTRREGQVARYLAQGYTDRQIADELFVSVGTVGNHVHHILQKLGLSSRVQVSGWLDTHHQTTVAATTTTA